MKMIYMENKMSNIDLMIRYNQSEIQKQVDQM